MKRILATLIAAVLAVGLLALPAAAHHTEDVGLIVGGRARVTKAPGVVCHPNGTLTGDSDTDPGIGLPIPGVTKHAKYKFSGPVTTLEHGDGIVQVCGNLAPVFDNLLRPNAIGAACGMSKGYNGKGLVKWDSLPDSLVRGVEWKFSAASFFVFTGKLDGSFLAGIVSARGTRAQCLEKHAPVECTTGKAHCGAGNFDVDVLLVNDPDEPPVRLNDRPGSPKGANDHPLFCKGSRDADNNGSKETKCPYKTKPKAKPNS